MTVSISTRQEDKEESKIIISTQAERNTARSTNVQLRRHRASNVKSENPSWKITVLSTPSYATKNLHSCRRLCHTHLWSTPSQSQSHIDAPFAMFSFLCGLLWAWVVWVLVSGALSPLQTKASALLQGRSFWALLLSLLNLHNYSIQRGVRWWRAGWRLVKTEDVRLLPDQLWN